MMKNSIKTLISVIFLVELSRSVPVSGGLECPQCMHLGFKLTNMPSEVSSYVNQMLGPILGQYSNPACEQNTAAAETCPISGGNGTRVCDSFTFKLTGVGMTAANLPEAGMEISVVARSCGTLAAGDSPKCTPILDLIEAGQKAEILTKLSQLSAQFEKVTYDGQHCQSAGSRFYKRAMLETA